MRYGAEVQFKYLISAPSHINISLLLFQLANLMLFVTGKRL